MWDPIISLKEFRDLPEGPIFEHCDDCCIFIGHGVDPLNGGFVDLYVCKVGRDRTPELLFRYGNEPHEYACRTLDMRTLCRSTCSKKNAEGEWETIPDPIGECIRRLFRDGSFHAEEAANAQLENPTRTQEVWGRKFRFEIRLVEVDEEAEDKEWRKFNEEENQERSTS